MGGCNRPHLRKSFSDATCFTKGNNPTSEVRLNYSNVAANPGVQPWGQVCLPWVQPFQRSIGPAQNKCGQSFPSTSRHLSIAWTRLLIQTQIRDLDLNPEWVDLPQEGNPSLQVYLQAIPKSRIFPANVQPPLLQCSPSPIVARPTRQPTPSHQGASFHGQTPAKVALL